MTFSKWKILFIVLIYLLLWLNFSFAVYCSVNKYWNRYCTYDDWSYEYWNWNNEWNPYKDIPHYKSSSTTSIYDWFSSEEDEAYADNVRYEEEQRRKEQMEYEEFCENHWPEDWCPSHGGKGAEAVGWLFALIPCGYLIYYMVKW